MNTTKCGEQDSKKNLDVKSHWSNFTQEATVHGISKLSGSKFKTAVWASILLCSFTYLVYILSKQLVYYYSYPLRSEMTVEFHKEMFFPAVTICSLSWRNKSLTDNSPQADIFYGSVHQLRDILPEVNWSDPFYNESGYFEDGDISNFRSSSMLMENMLRHCWFDNALLDCSSYFESVVTFLGQCFTFNRNSKLKTRFYGSRNNLRIYIDANLDWYTWGEDLSAGIQVIVHDPDIFPDVQNEGFRVQPGTSAYAETLKHTFSFLPRPFQAFGSDYCEKDLPKWTYHNRSYVFTTSTCFQKCFALATYAWCGCRHFMDAIDGKICSRYQYSKCYVSTKDFVMNDIDIREKCNCHRPCYFNTYTTSMSTATFPSDFIAEKFEQSGEEGASYLKRNGIYLNVYFKDLSTHTFRQSPLYSSIGEVLGQLGGQMGLFLGASIVSFIEIGEFVVTLLVLTYRKAQRGKKTDSVKGLKS